MRLQLAGAAHLLEGHLAFEFHELTNRFAVLGYSAAYFVLFPLLLAVVGIGLARRPSIRPFRVFSTAVAINYLMCLPFFLLFPVPERWWYPDSGAIILSDLWSTRLIDLFRPISGLDNSFPSFHVSLTMVLAAAAFIFGMRLRWTIACLGGTVILATFVLGSHWLADMVAGAAAGVLSIALALRLSDRHDRTPQPAAAGAGSRQVAPRQPVAAGAAKEAV
jgi:hypothetical protein